VTSVVQWLGLAFSKGPNRIGFSRTWGRKQIQFPKRRVSLGLFVFCTRTMDIVRKLNVSESYTPSSESYSNYLPIWDPSSHKKTAKPMSQSPLSQFSGVSGVCRLLQWKTSQRASCTAAEYLMQVSHQSSLFCMFIILCIIRLGIESTVWRSRGQEDNMLSLMRFQSTYRGISWYIQAIHRVCGLVVRVSGYRCTGHGFDSRP
jgi:hypothetical protein